MSSLNAFGRFRLHTVMLLLVALIAYSNNIVASSESDLDSSSEFPERLQRGVRAALEPILEDAWDEREYRHITLHNNMTILLVSDPDAESESATMAVNVGGMFDPDTIPGLAHLTEHMLFRSASEKYPEESSLPTFVLQKIGEFFCMTSETQTVYSFDVSNGNLYRALDRFAQIFISPVFNKKAIDKEINAIEKEFVLISQNDGKRAYRLVRSTSDPKHRFRNFVTGNKKSLKQEPARMGINILKAVREFFEKHYSAERMQLVVLGKDSLDELQSKVVDQFSAVPNRGHKVEEETRMPYLKSSLPAILRVVPGYKNDMALRVWWQVPGAQHHYRENPLEFIAELLSLQGKGSISSVLKQKNLGTDCVSVITEPSTGFSLLELSFGGGYLTISNFKEVVSIVFAYLSMLRKADMSTLESHYMNMHQQWLHRLFSENPSSIKYCRELARNMRFFEPIDCIRGYGFLHFNDTLIREYLTYLTPENIIIDITSPGFEEQADRIEPWFDIKYSVESPTQFNVSSTAYEVYLLPFVSSEGLLSAIWRSASTAARWLLDRVFHHRQ